MPRSFIWRRTPMIQMDGRWLCSARCVEAEARATFEHMSIPKEPFAGHRVPLGLLMLARGFLSEEQLQAVLAARTAGWSWKNRVLGTEAQLCDGTPSFDRAQLAVVVPRFGPANAARLSLHGNDSLEVVAVSPHDAGTLHSIDASSYMALCEGIDHGALLAIEQLLRCHVVPCLVSDHAMDGWIDRKWSWTAPGVFSTKRQARRKWLGSQQAMRAVCAPIRSKSFDAGTTVGCD